MENITLGQQVFVEGLVEARVKDIDTSIGYATIEAFDGKEVAVYPIGDQTLTSVFIPLSKGEIVSVELDDKEKKSTFVEGTIVSISGDKEPVVEVEFENNIKYKYDQCGRDKRYGFPAIHRDLPLLQEE